MARITVEDCIEKVENRFHLVQMAAIRTKQLKKGARPLVEDSGNKEVVTALREVAAGVIKPDLATEGVSEEFAEELSTELKDDYSTEPGEVLSSGIPAPEAEESVDIDSASSSTPVEASPSLEGTTPVEAGPSVEGTTPVEASPSEMDTDSKEPEDNI